MKKIIIVSVIILAITALAFGVYFGWKKSQEVLNPPLEKNNLGEGLNIPVSTPAEAVSNLIVVADDQIFDYWLVYPASAGKTSATSTKPLAFEIYYFDKKGKILKVSEGEDEVIISNPIENLQWVKPRPDGRMALLKFGPKENSQINIYDVNKKQFQALAGAVSADFGPDNRRVAYLESDGDLMVKDATVFKSTAVKILNVNVKDVEVVWRNSASVFLVSKPSFYYDGEIWSVDLNSKTIKLFASGKGLTAKWSDGGKLGVIFSVNSSREGKTRLVNEKGETRANFSFVTLPDKCFIGSQKIYCGAPITANVLGQIILPDDYLKEAVYFNDSVNVIDVEANTNTIILPYNQNSGIDAVNLKLYQNQLFFINRYDNKLYSLAL